MEKRVAILLISKNIGGSERRFARYFEWLRRSGRGDNTFLVVHRYLLSLLKLHGLIVNETNVIVVGMKPDSIFVNYKMFVKLFDHLIVIRDLRRVFKHLKPDIVNEALGVRYQFYLPKCRKVCNYVSTKVIKGVPPGYKSRIAFYLGYQFDIASELIKSKLLEYGIKDRGNLHVSPCSFIDYSNTYIGQKKDRVTFIGRLYSTKNPELFIRMIPKVTKEYPSCRFVICGDGPDYNKIKRMILEYGIEAKVQMMGEISNPEQYLADSLIFTSLQYPENYHSQALMEAMACGCAIIATDVGSTNVLVDESVGILIKVGDEEQLSKAVINLLRDRERAIEMGMRARLKVMSEHTVERYHDYLQGIYKCSEKNIGM